MKRTTTTTTASTSLLRQFSLKLPVITRSRLLMLAVLPVAATLAASQTQASTWLGNGADGNWGNSLNWDSVPGSGTPILFSGTPLINPSNTATIDNIASTTVFGGITFDGSATNYSIGGTGPLSPGGDIINNSASVQTFNIPIALTANRNFTTVTGGTTNYNGIISGSGVGVTFNGGGTTNIGASNTYTGMTTLNGGSVNYAADNSIGLLSFGVTPTASPASTSINTLSLTTGNLTTTGLLVQTNTSLATPQTISIGAGKTLIVNGNFTVGLPSVNTIPNAGTVTALAITGNSLVVNGAANNFNVSLSRTNGAAGTDPKSSLDMSGLSTFSYTGTTGQFIVGSGNGQGNLTLANTSNTITTAQLHVGDSFADGSGSDDNNPNNNLPSLMLLGAGTNVINATSILIGSDKGNGNISFVSPTSGTLTIAGLAGTAASTSNITIGQYSSGGSALSPVSVLNLAGHNVTVQGGNVVVGILSGTGTSAGTNSSGNLTFDTGTFNAVNLQLGVVSAGTMVNGASGTFTLGTSPASTGILNVTGSFNLGARTVNTAAGKSTANFIINGGTANISTDITDASTFLASGGSVPNATTLTLNAGTLNMGSHNIGSYASPIANINLTGGTLNSSGNIAGRAIVLGSPTVIGTPTYVLSDGGSLTLSGPLSLSGGGGLGGGGSSNVGTVSGGDVTLGAGSTLAAGSSTVTGTLNFGGNLNLNAAHATFKFGPGVNDLVNVSGTLTLTGTIPLSFPALGAGPFAGTYTLFSYGSLSGDETNLSLGSNTTRFSYSIVPTSTTPGTIQVTVGGSGPLPLTYIGNGSSNFDLKTTADFKDISNNAQQFFSLDTPTFDDTSTNLADVQVIGTLIAGNVTVSATRDYTFAGAGTINSPQLTKDGTGNLTITNTNNFTATTIVNGTLFLGNGGTTGSINSAITNNANLVVNRSGTYAFGSTITGSGNVTFTGGGNVTLGTAANNYNGNTTIASGIVKVSNSFSLGAVTGTVGNVTILPGATLDIGGDPTHDDANMNFQGKVFTIAGTGVGGVGAITNTGFSQQNVFNFVTLSGDATVSGFRTDVGRTTTGATLDLAGHTLTINMDAASGSTFAMLTHINVTPGNIVVNTGGTAIESNASILADASSSITYNPNTYGFFYQTNPLNVTRQMIVKNNVAFGAGSTTVAAINAPISLQGSLIFRPLVNGLGNVTNDAADNFPLTLQGSITESGGSFGITKLGINTTVLAGTANVWSGASAVNGGTLEFAPHTDPASTTVSPSTSSIGSVSGTGGGSIVIDASATVTSDGIQTNGPLTINGGLAVRNAATPSLSKVTSLAIAGTPGPGGASDTTSVYTGSLDLSNSKLIVEDSSANRATDLAVLKNQALTVNTAAGTVGIYSSTANTFNTAAGKIVKVVAVSDNAVRMATFPAGSSNFGGVNNVDANSILIEATYKGDANLDGVVDIQDLTDVANHWQQSVTDWSQGDFDGSNFVDISDLTSIANNWQAGVGSSSSLSVMPSFNPVTAVPEPTSLALLAVGGLILSRRRRA